MYQNCHKTFAYTANSFIYDNCQPCKKDVIQTISRYLWCCWNRPKLDITNRRHIKYNNLKHVSTKSVEIIFRPWIIVSVAHWWLATEKNDSNLRNTLGFYNKAEIVVLCFALWCKCGLVRGSKQGLGFQCGVKTTQNVNLKSWSNWG